MQQSTTRRGFVQVCAAGVLTVSAQSKRAFAKAKTRKTTFTYKKVGNLEIKLDVHRLDDSIVRPVVVWIHGGALINGHRAQINGRVIKQMLDDGYVVVSIDYRLAPETKLPHIIEDIEDAFKQTEWAGKSEDTGITRAFITP